jgi:hypothetical protein
MGIYVTFNQLIDHQAIHLLSGASSHYGPGVAAIHRSVKAKVGRHQDGTRGATKSKKIVDMVL